MKKYTFDDSFFEIIDTEEKAYWLGFIVADGYINSRKNTVGICLDIKDTKHLEKFKKSIKYSGNIFTRKSRFSVEHPYTEKAILEIYSKKLVENLENLGITPEKSKNMGRISSVPPELFNHFVRGVVDGDGCIFETYVSNKKRPNKYYSPGITIVGAKKLLEQICEYIPDSPKTLPKDKRTNFTHILYLRSKLRFKKIYDYLYHNSSIHLDRKYDKANNIINLIKKSSETIPSGSTIK